MVQQLYTERYSALLKCFVTTRAETCLVEAADLGREMVEAGLPMEDLGEIQEEAVRSLAAELPHQTLGDVGTLLTAPMLEVLMAYGLAYRELLIRWDRVSDEMVHVERLRASGELAAGVSHNLNNMLTAVLGPAQLLLRTNRDPAVGREVEAILAAGRRARDLVVRLNEAVRATPSGPLAAVALNERVESVVHMARSRWKDEPETRGVNIDVVTDLQEVPPVRGIASEVDDAILNLLLNAVDAMPAGGTLTLTTRADRDGARLSVRDTGVGMDAPTRRRVFQPFYTTKSEVGSGLGLSSVYATVTRCGGTIAVDSSPGEGTAFDLWLPAWADPDSPPPPPSPPAPVRQAPRRGRLLIVEDDAEVADLLYRLLSATHAVEVLQEGAAVLQRFAPGRYDAALIDLSLPGMAGDQVATQIRGADPSVATVLITGWMLERRDVRLSCFDFELRKPFDDLASVEAVVAEAIHLHHTRCESAEG